MLKSRKHVFWEALVIAIAIFLIGLFFGMMIEMIKSNTMSDFYANSETSLVDGLAISQLSTSEFSCESLKNYNIEFADKVYQEAKMLEQYEDSGKLTNNLKALHRKYDLLRTLAWMSNTNSLEQCGNYNLVVYLYEYDTEVLDKKATQNVWSKMLLDVKQANEAMVLLPIAVDQNITSLNLLKDKYNITQFPALVINNEKVVNSIGSLEELKSLLK
jgi:hypothetical protein